MKKKTLLLNALLLAIAPFYNTKAACMPSTIIEYINADELLPEEQYDIQETKNVSHEIWGIDNNNFVIYAIYGDSYEIKDGKIVGLNNYCVYKECYKDIVGKYIIKVSMYTDEVKNGATPMDDIDFSYNQNKLALIESSTSTSYISTDILFRKVVGEELKESNEIKGLVDDINEIIEEMPGYTYVSYDTDKHNYGCGGKIIRLYYKNVKQEFNETVNISEIKNIKMKSYFKDLESTKTTVSYRVLDTSIAKVDSEGNIKPLKVGETEIIATANGVEYILHLRVTQDMITNPDTASPIIMILCVIGILISGTTIYLKDQTN